MTIVTHPIRSIAAPIAAALALIALALACGDDAPTPEPTEVPAMSSTSSSAPCAEGRALRFAFYAFFEPVSYSADADPDSPGYHAHEGYEADLLNALEAMSGAGLSFERKPVGEWEDIWLLSAGPDFDLAGGGITILESRTMDDAGNDAVRFTNGHVVFRQSLLVRSEDAARMSDYDSLGSDVRVGALVATTGEARLLQLTGLADADGRLAAGTTIETDAGTLTADGTAAYVITAADATPNLDERTKLRPPSDDMPQVIYLGDELGETELLDSLRDGHIDAVARGEVGNGLAARYSKGALTISAWDTAVEYGGFTLPADEPALLACLNDKLDYLTDHRAIGYQRWLDDPQVFMRRAENWRP